MGYFVGCGNIPLKLLGGYIDAYKEREMHISMVYQT
jgi:hypothetical protein